MSTRRSLAHRIGATWLLAAALTVSACSTSAQAGREVVPDAREVRVEEVTYRQIGEETLRGDVYRRQDLRAPTPGVLVVHGGSWARGSRDRMARVARRLADAGFVAFTVDYRLAPAHPYPAALEDLRSALRWMRDEGTRHGIDGERLGAFGYSAGGHLVALLATTEAEGVQAAVLGGAPTDLRRLAASRAVQRFLGGAPDDISDVYAAASPITHVDASAPPFFLYHGRYDWIVDDSHARRFAAALAESGVPHEYLELPLGHVAAFLFDDEAMDAAVVFLDRWLRPAMSDGVRPGAAWRGSR